MSTLVLWSGGVDSTAALLHCLRELDEPVHVLYIESKTDAGRWEAENLAVKKCRVWLETNERPFTFHTATLDVRGMIHGPNVEGIPHYGIAAMLADELVDVMRICVGWCAEDLAPTKEFESSIRWLLESITGYLRDSTRDGIELFLPLASMGKIEQYKYVGEELAALVWGCRTPVEVGDGFEECGGCVWCKQKAALRKGEHYDLYGSPRTIP